jgi:hypothetical protein
MRKKHFLVFSKARRNCNYSIHSNICLVNTLTRRSLDEQRLTNCTHTTHVTFIVSQVRVKPWYIRFSLYALLSEHSVKETPDSMTPYKKQLIFQP